MSRTERIKQLLKLAEEKDAYGGAVFELSPKHKGGMMSKNGFSRAVCEYLEMKDDKPHCGNEYYIKWNSGKTRLPVDDPKTYCSDWFNPK